MKNGTTPRALAQLPTTISVEELDDYLALYWTYCRDATVPADTRAFINALIHRLNPPTRRHLRFDCWTLRVFCTWTTGYGLPLDIETMFTPAIVALYLECCDLTLESKRTVRDRLQKIAREVTVKAPWPAKPTTLPRSRLPRPYPPGDVAQIMNAVKRLQPADRDRMTLLVLLGIGCGLDGRCMPGLRRSDITVADDGVHVAVTPPARTVTCLALYETGLARAVERFPWRADGRMFGPAPQSVTNFCYRIRRHMRHPNVELGRLRSTWLLEHLSSGTPIKPFLHGAGLSTASNLCELVAMVPLPDTTATAAFLRKA